MAKGQMRGNRELKKPKQEKKPKTDMNSASVSLGEQKKPKGGAR